MTERTRAELRLGALLCIVALLFRGLSSVGHHSVDGLDEGTLVSLPVSLPLLLMLLDPFQFLIAIFFALHVDRRGPRWVMAVGVVTVGFAWILMMLTSNPWQFVAVRAALAIGEAAVGATILYAVAIKGCFQLRGTVVGVLAILL